MLGQRPMMRMMNESRLLGPKLKSWVFGGWAGYVSPGWLSHVLGMSGNLLMSADTRQWVTVVSVLYSLHVSACCILKVSCMFIVLIWTASGLLHVEGLLHANSVKACCMLKVCCMPTVSRLAAY